MPEVVSNCRRRSGNCCRAGSSVSRCHRCLLSSSVLIITLLYVKAVTNLLTIMRIAWPEVILEVSNNLQPDCIQQSIPLAAGGLHYVYHFLLFSFFSSSRKKPRQARLFVFKSANRNSRLQIEGPEHFSHLLRGANRNSRLQIGLEHCNHWLSAAANPRRLSFPRAVPPE